MGNERTTTERTGAGFSFCCFWKAAPFFTDLWISKNSSNLKGPLLEIWLQEDLRLVLGCESDSEIDHHRLQYTGRHFEASACP